jgi:hypothetical protein
MGWTSLRLKHHLFIVGGLLLLAFGIVVARNWTTFALIYDNMTAMNEGKHIAQQVRYPSDLLTYMADHPERVSLVAYDVGAPSEGIFYQAEEPRSMVSVPNLMLLAEYARRTAEGQLRPDRRVPLMAIDPYVLPGAGAAQHQQARAHWRERGWLDADSTVAFQHIVRAIAQFNDRASTDWLISELGRSQVEALPAQLGLGSTAPPRPLSGTHLSWNHHAASRPVEARLAAYQSMAPDTYVDRVYQLTHRLRQDTMFRSQEQERLRQRGTDISLRQQRAFAQATYPHGTAAAYAQWMERLALDASPSDSASAFVRRHLERVVRVDSIQQGEAEAPMIIGSKAGALPGVVSFVGYVRHGDDRPPRVVAVFMEDVPIGLFYHLMQTGIDRGLYVQLLTDDTFFRDARGRLERSTVAAR